MKLPTTIARSLAAASPTPDRPPQPDPLYRRRAVVFGMQGAREMALLTDRDEDTSRDAYLVCDGDALVDTVEVR
ncbi:hypothetical protein [Haloarcula pellucida]|uniref:Uncharacterized protein n=1 Tax=Haloarcula pellucida TaxID=1427151 RepID=A0A830GG45_9EURY|nr:hypothetical protein [Halomicroarcula pellucida]MBX0346601.1 hypothetical protein [Halomicroarcula pellucida]GGN84495.1 hypothetical protein GCM10009030_00190 [Halomicroarcula pellucida]